MTHVISYAAPDMINNHSTMPSCTMQTRALSRTWPVLQTPGQSTTSSLQAFRYPIHLPAQRNAGHRTASGRNANTCCWHGVEPSKQKPRATRVVSSVPPRRIKLGFTVELWAEDSLQVKRLDPVSANACG